MLRRLKEKTLTLPPVQLKSIILPLESPKEQTLYTSFFLSAKKSISRENTGTMFIFEQLLRLRQLCCHPYLVSVKPGENKISGK